ncbi:Ribosomal protein S24-S35 [Babesia duncani]|uniref:Ribosomal protein S24-S35 n=1 Tax=Babesia duncani TaxID=323732 RepID=A0AAD9UP12_9APIC|nr:Ribosomal protein S24-S35 [Babesia duncani]
MMGKKKRRKTEKIPKTEEATAIKSSNVIRLQDRVGTPETAISIAKAIRRQVNSVVQGNVTKKHFARMLQYRMARATGNTHDNRLTKLPSSFVTPLTRLQHESHLPTTMGMVFLFLKSNSIDGQRHDFPHELSYTVEWFGSASPAKIKSDKSVTLTFNVNDLNLTPMQTQKMIKILGSKYDETTASVKLIGNIFDDLNRNAAYLGKLSYVKFHF